MHEPPAGTERGRSPAPSTALVAALLLGVLVAIVSAQPSVRSAGVPDPAAAHAERDPDDDGLAGWYTDEQAERGRESYLEHCAECHSPDLKARSAYISLYAYPALTGAYFWDRWGGQSVHALLLVTQETMPLHAPGSLDGETYADIAAHVLRVNGFPSGDRDLPAATADVERLVAMPIEPGYARPQARAQEVGVRPPPDDEAPEPAEGAPAGAEADDPEPEEAEAEEAEPEEAEPEEAEPEEDVEEIEPDELDDESTPRRDGWFTQAQVDRARPAYARHCARCHGSTMQGIGVAPSLAGENFMARWDGESVADLFWVVDELMPLEDPEAIPPRTAADLVAYILAQNGFEAGAIELPADEDRLTPFVIGEDGPAGPDEPDDDDGDDDGEPDERDDRDDDEGDDDGSDGQGDDADA
jgi:S-disulfanyl-L-cysteine oxidoreductase SoxD